MILDDDVPRPRKMFTDPEALVKIAQEFLDEVEAMGSLSEDEDSDDSSTT